VKYGELCILVSGAVQVGLEGEGKEDNAEARRGEEAKRRAEKSGEEKRREE
jgi:hypothetical protein